MQIDKQDLCNAVIDAKQQGVLTNRLASMCLDIARSYIFSDKCNKFSESHREEILGVFSLYLVNKWGCINEKRNAFSWVVFSARKAQYTYIRSLRRRIERESKKAHLMYEQQIEQMESYIRQNSKQL